MKNKKLEHNLNDLLNEKKSLFKRIKEIRNQLEAIKDQEIFNRRQHMKDIISKSAILVLSGDSFNKVAKIYGVNPGSLQNNVLDLLRLKNPKTFSDLKDKAQKRGYWHPLIHDVRKAKEDFLKFL